MTERTVAVKLVGRTDAYVREMDKAKRATGSFSKESSSDIKKLGSTVDDVGKRSSNAWGGSMASLQRHTHLTALAGAAAFGAFVSSSLAEASSLEESINAVNVTFGDAADSILALGENSAKSFGLATSEFNSFAVQFSAFGKTVAAGTGQGIDTVIEDITTRVADFASVMNLDLNEATQVFMSTLSGETEPIRRFGKDISAAAVENFALATGLAKTKGEMTEQIKVQARYALLMQETADVTGDFANTAEGAANAGRIAAAEWKNFRAEAGEKMLPVLADVLQTMTELVETADKLHLPDLFGGIANAPNKLFEGARNWGRTTRAIFTEFSLETGNQKMVRQFEESEQAAGDFDRTLLKGLDTFDQVHAKALELTGSMHAANLIAIDWSKTEGQAIAIRDQLARSTESYAQIAASTDIATVEHKAHVDDVRQALFRQGEITADVADATEQEAAASELAAEALQRHRDVVDALREAEERRLDIVNQSLGGALRLSGAQRDARDSLWRYNQQVAESNAAAPEHKLNQDQLNAITEQTALDQLAAAEAAAAYRIEQAEMAGATVSAYDEQRILNEELDKVTANLTGPVRDAVIAATTDLDNLARDRFFTVNGRIVMTNTGREGDIVTFATSAAGGGGYGAEGGIINRPTWMLAGEAGREALVPLDSLPGNAPLSSGMLGGGSVSITFAPGSVLLPNVTRPGEFLAEFAETVRFNGPAEFRRLLDIRT